MSFMKVVRKIQKSIGLGASIKVSDADSELIQQVLDYVQLDSDATKAQRALELDDLRYCDPATQWDEEDRKSREDSGRPILTEDRLGPFLTQVCNEQRKNKPGVQVNPVDGSGDILTAEVIQGYIRHIEYGSNADTAYDTAFESAVRVGRGFYRVCTDYIDETTLDQEIQIKRVPNIHMVFVDPAAQEADYSDMKWGGFKVWVSREDYKEQYPNSELATSGSASWASIGDDAPEWMSQDGGAIMVVECFYKVFTKKTIEVDGKKRELLETSVKWVKCTAVEILERREFPGIYIPIVAVLGKELNINGTRTYSGLIRSGKDPQKRYNYLLTAQVERIAFMPLATWIGAKGFMGKEKKLWALSHKQQIAALEFEIIGDNGQGINMPRLITEEAPIIAVTNALQGAADGMKATLGMYDPSLGNREGSQSGRAIERLQSQGETGNYHFQDNLSRAMRYEGRIILGLMPTVVDTDRILRIIGEDGSQETVRVNGPVKVESEALKNKRELIGKIFDLKTGKYDVTISTGPSYQSRRQEDRAMLLGMLQGPMGQLVASRAGDLVAKTLDSPIAKDLATRLTPPDIAQQGQSPEMPPQAMQQFQQMDGMIQQLQQALAEAQDQIQSEQIKAQTQMQTEQAKIQADWAKANLDAETRVQIAQMNNETELIKIQATLNAKEADAQIAQQMEELNSAYVDLANLVMSRETDEEPQEDLGGVDPALADVGAQPQPI